jgi:hypothetical protein
MRLLRLVRGLVRRPRPAKNVDMNSHFATPVPVGEDAIAAEACAKSLWPPCTPGDGLPLLLTVFLPGTPNRLRTSPPDLAVCFSPRCPGHDYNEGFFRHLS